MTLPGQANLGLSALSYDMHIKPKKFLNKKCRVTYEDAHYSYDTIDLKNFVVPPFIVSTGKIRRIDDQLIDISPIQNEKKNVKGVVIPIKAVKEIIILDEK